MINIFKKIFGKKSKQESQAPASNIQVVDENGNPEDDLTTAAIKECYRTGKPVIAERDEKGNIYFR